MKIKLLILSILLMPTLFAADFLETRMPSLFLEARKLRNLINLFNESNRTGNLDPIRNAIDRGALDVNAKYGLLGATPLMVACSNNCTKICKLLINEYKVDVNVQKEFDGCTSLMIATEWGYFEIAELLVNNKADLNLKNNDGETALHLGTNVNHGNQCLRLLIDFGADINSIDNRNKTLLDQVLFLFNLAKTNPFARPINFSRFRQLFDLLIDKEAKFNIRSDENINTYNEVLNESLERKRQILELVSTDNFAALKEAIKNHAYMWKEAQEYIHAKYKELFRAVRSGNCDTILQLLSQGLSINIKDKSGYTALHIACSNGNTELIKFLLSIGADPTIYDNNGRLAIDVGLEGGPDILTCFIDHKKDEAEAMVYEQAVELQEGFESGCEDAVIAPMAVDDAMEMA